MRATRAALPGAIGVLAAALLVAGCGSGGTSSSATGKASPTVGAAVYVQDCAVCHGDAGQGGAGPRLAGVVKKQFPDIRTQILFVSQGSGAMPAFASRLSPAEIQAVVEYTRSLS